MGSDQNKRTNIAFIDAQNLYLGTTKCSPCADAQGIDFKSMKMSNCKCGFAWKVDLARFRIYLRDKYNVSEAYYVLGYVHDENGQLYQDIQKAGYIVLFKEHNYLARSTKKGNVDTDIVFEAMKNLVDNKHFNKIVMVSGDGDYQKLIQYLISKGRFSKILFPNRMFASSLYKKLGSEYFDYLENLKSYIALK